MTNQMALAQAAQIIEARKAAMREEQRLANPFAGLLDSANDAARARQEEKTGHEDDYIGPDGLLMCGRCHTPCQMVVDVPEFIDPTGKRTVFHACACIVAEQKAWEAEQEAIRRKQRIDELRINGAESRRYAEMTFAMDDGGGDRQAADRARNYVENWQETRELPSPGLLLFGGVGGGKTFWAACIGNELKGRGYSVLITNVPTLTSLMAEDFERNKRRILDVIASVDLLVLDDIGVERSTGYGHEKLYEIINTRDLSGRPLIVTTNLSFQELENPDQMEYNRVFDRIIGMTRPVHVKADGRRKRIAQESARTMDKLLGLS